MSGARAMVNLGESIAGRTALVTGGSRGIGRATAEILLTHGAQVALTYNLHADEAAELAARFPGRASVHRLDLRDESCIARCFDEVVEKWKGLDIVVNNAAVGTATVTSYEPDPSRVDAALVDINLLGVLRVAQTALKVMRGLPKAQGSRKLVNLSSVGGLQIFPSMKLADNMSKAAVLYMGQQLAAETVHEPIDIFTVCPGATDTAMFRASTLDKLSPAERERLLAKLPKGRLVQPEEVATTILFLASEHSAAMHGAVLDLSLGLGVHPGLLTGAKG